MNDTFPNRFLIDPKNSHQLRCRITVPDRLSEQVAAA